MTEPATESTGIFRRSAVERLASPERLDLLVNVITQKNRAALVTVLGCALATVLWGVFGSLPTKLHAPCIFTRAGGVLEVSSGSRGRIVDFRVQVGDRVKAGDVIARIDQPEQLRQLDASEKRLGDLRLRAQSLSNFAMRGNSLNSELKRGQEADLRSRIASAESRLGALALRVKTQQTLLEQGLITQNQLLATRIEYDSVSQEISSARTQIKELAVRQLEGQRQSEAELATTNLEIAELERQIQVQRDTMEAQSALRSPYSGRVLELRAGGMGVLVEVGATLMTLEPEAAGTAGALEVVIFAPPGDGKNVKPGMDAQVSPANVRREESGFLAAYVRSVADYPSSRQGIMRVLQNERLVDQLSNEGAPIKLVADLVPDAATPSGFKWSSGRGPNQQIDAGTLCDASVTLERRAPISLVLPLLRKALGG